jgi:DNA-binding MarR family transcriptional regulator
MPRRTRRQPTGAAPAVAGPSVTPDAETAAALADRLHSAAIHLLRRLRLEDAGGGLPAPQLSALSVIVFAGPIALGDLAAAEQVRPPTISRLARELERAGLVMREGDARDRRVQRLRATPAGERLLAAGRQRRVARLAAAIDDLTAVEREALATAAPLLERLARAAVAGATAAGAAEPAPPARR